MGNLNLHYTIQLLNSPIVLRCERRITNPALSQSLKSQSKCSVQSDLSPNRTTTIGSTVQHQISWLLLLLLYQRYVVYQTKHGNGIDSVEFDYLVSTNRNAVYYTHKPIISHQFIKFIKFNLINQKRRSRYQPSVNKNSLQINTQYI